MTPPGATTDPRTVADLEMPAPARELDVTLVVNGARLRLTVDARTTLLDALRDRLPLTGTKKGCELGQWGACTVLLEGRRINACLTLAVMHEGLAITTIEGLASGDDLHPVQAPFSGAPAIANAVYHATGTRVRELPITLEKIL